MIGVILALALQVDSASPSPSATPSPTPRPAPTARPLPKPTPPYLIAPKGWSRIPDPRHGVVSASVAGWTRIGFVRGEEDVIVTKFFSAGRTAEEIARPEVTFDRGGIYPTLVANKARALCGGTVPGWEVIATSGRGVGSHTNDEIYATDGVKGYEVRYYRETAFAPAPEAVAALRSFCPTRARILSSTVTRGAIVPPASWNTEDLSLAYRLPPGAATLYSAPFTRGGDQVILVLRQPTPDGVSANVGADIEQALNSVGKEPHTILSRQGVELCDGDGWIVDVRRPGTRRDAFETWVFHFGAPNSYVALYRRFVSSPSLPAALKAIKTLCPPK